MENKFYTPDDALITGIRAIIAEDFSRNLSKKLRNNAEWRKKKAANGEKVSPRGGRIFGFYLKDGILHVNEEQAITVRKIFRVYLETDSIRKTTDIINSLGYRSYTGKLFSITAIGRILRNPHYVGSMTIGRWINDFERKTLVRTDPSEWVTVVNIDKEVDAFMASEGMGQNKREFLLEHIAAIVPLGEKKFFVSLDLVGALMFGREELLDVYKRNFI